MCVLSGKPPPDGMWQTWWRRRPKVKCRTPDLGEGRRPLLYCRGVVNMVRCRNYVVTGIITSDSNTYNMSTTMWWTVYKMIIENMWRNIWSRLYFFTSEPSEEVSNPQVYGIADIFEIKKARRLRFSTSCKSA